jgi:hypothetical protein
MSARSTGVGALRLLLAFSTRRDGDTEAGSERHDEGE